MFPLGVEDALNLLDGSISDTIAARLRREAGLGSGGPSGPTPLPMVRSTGSGRF